MRTHSCKKLSRYVFIAALSIVVLRPCILVGQGEPLESSSSLPEGDSEFLAVAIREALSQWMHEVQNLSAEFECRIYNRDFSDNEYGKRVADSGWFQFDFKRIDNHYRLDSKWYLTQEATEAETVSVSTFNPDIGVGKSFGNNIAVEGEFARIDVDHDLVIRSNRLGFWVGSYDGFDKYGWISSTLSQDDWKLEKSGAEESLVLLTVPIFDDGGDNVGHRTLTLDQSKGYLPVAMTASTTGEHWRRESFRVKKTAQLNSTTWFPVDLKEELQTFALGENIISIFETKVFEVELDNVTHTDLDLVFPKNTQVIDVVSGVSYLADGQDGVIGEEYPIVGGMIAEAPASGDSVQPTNNSYTSLVLVNLFVVLIIVGLWLIRRSSSKKASANSVD